MVNGRNSAARTGPASIPQPDIPRCSHPRKTSHGNPWSLMGSPLLSSQTATYTFESTADLEQYMRGEDADPEREEYGRYGNPTVRELERRLAALEATDDAVAFSTGMAAITSTNSVTAVKIWSVVNVS